MNILKFLKGKIDYDVSLSCRKGLATISKPLYKSLKISYFQHIRLLENDNSFTIASDSRPLELFYQKHFFKTEGFENSLEHCQNQILLSCNAKGYAKKVSDEIAARFDIAHEITIVKREKKWCDFYSFATGGDINGAESMMLSNLPFLNAFILYYNNAAVKIIDTASKYPSFTSESKIQILSLADKLPRVIQTQYLDELRDHVTVNGINLTKKELACLHWIAQGKTIEEIGIILCISPRTVEKYYSSLKSKFSCYKNVTLIKKAIEMGMVS